MMISLSHGLVVFFRLIMAILLVEALTYGFLHVLEIRDWPYPKEWLIMAWQLVVVLFLWLFGTLLNLNHKKAIAHRAELAASQQKFSHLFERSPVPYLTLDRHGSITLVNLAALRFFGVSAEALIGENFLERLIADENLMAVLLGKFDAGQVINDEEVVIKILTGSERWVRLSIFVNSKDERLVSLIDITDQKRMDTAKSEFVALASHQLRTPIAAARWNVELLRGHTGAYDEKQLTYLDKIERNVIKMVNLIDDFLSVSKLETGTFATDVTEIDLTSFCDAVIEEYQQEIVKKNIKLEKEYVQPGLKLKADQRLLHITISNLISNAVKYCRDHGTVFIGYRAEEGRVVLTIADSGIGVPANDLPNLFSKFFRASNAQLYKTEGTGLGLYIVGQSVAQMGGTISVDSEENVGTEFIIKLNLSD